MPPYTIGSARLQNGSLKVSKDSWERQCCKSGDLHCVYRQKDNRNRLEAGEIFFLLKNVDQAVHSNMFLYFADLPVSSNLYRLYSRRAGVRNSV